MKLLFGALALAGLAVPATASPLRAAQTAPSPDLDRLVRLLAPDSTMLDLAMKGLDSSMPAKPAAAPADAAMKAYVAAQLRPELQRVLVRELPSLRSDIAAILTAELTPPEVTDAANFFASPTGQKLYAAAIGSIGQNPGMNEDQAREAAMSAAMASLAPEDYPAVIAFGASGASAKMGTINPLIATASKTWSARLIAENGDRLSALALRAAEDYQKKGRKAQ